jgi:hypothetical protein
VKPVRRFPLFGYPSPGRLWDALLSNGADVSLSSVRNWQHRRNMPQSQCLHGMCEALRLTQRERVQLIADLAPLAGQSVSE